MSDGVRSFFQNVQRCRLCYGDAEIHVPIPEPIPASIRVLVIGEQPQDRPAMGNGSPGTVEAESRLPARNGLEDERAAPAATPGRGETEHLESYLRRAGIDSSDILYVTAVLCVPRDRALRPKRPTAAETKNCSSHLKALIGRIRPKLIVTLGHTGLLALQLAFPEWKELRQFILNYDVGGVLTRVDITVYPLYLPSESTRRARPESRQVRDWQRIPLLLDSLDKAARAR